MTLLETLVDAIEASERDAQRVATDLEEWVRAEIARGRPAQQFAAIRRFAADLRGDDRRRRALAAAQPALKAGREGPGMAPWIRPVEACTILGVMPRTLLSHAERWEIRSIQIGSGRHRYYHKEDVERRKDASDRPGKGKG